MRGSLSLLAGEIEVVHPFGELDRSASRAEQNVHVPGLFQAEGGPIKTRVAKSFLGSADRHRHGAGEAGHFFGGEIVAGVETLQFRGDGDRETLRIEKRDPSGARTPFVQGPGEALAPQPVGGETPDSRDDGSASHFMSAADSRTSPGANTSFKNRVRTERNAFGAERTTASAWSEFPTFK